MTTDDNRKTISEDIAYDGPRSPRPTPTAEDLERISMGRSGLTVVVHKTDEEGGILIDKLSGDVVTPQDDIPAWASGFYSAMLGARMHFYEGRLGIALPDQAKADAGEIPPLEPKKQELRDLLFGAEAMNADDIDWLTVDEEGLLGEHPAENEFRAQVVVECILKLGSLAPVYDGEILTGLAPTTGHTSWQTEIDLDRERSPEEIAAIEKAATSGFLPMKTGTEG